MGIKGGRLYRRPSAIQIFFNILVIRENEKKKLRYNHIKGDHRFGHKLFDSGKWYVNTNRKT